MVRISLVILGLVSFVGLLFFIYKIYTEYSFLLRLSDSKYRPVCEQSGGKWYEKRGSDLPVAGCICEYNKWRERHLNDIIERGCNCNADCTTLDENFPPYNAEDLLKQVKNRTGEKQILREDLSYCSFSSLKENICVACVKDADCGDFSSGGFQNNISHSEKPVCEQGKCRYKRTLYIGN